jgi:transposase
MSDTIPMVPENCPISARNSVQLKSEPCPKCVGIRNCKAKIALEAIKAHETINQFPMRHEMHPHQVTQWKQQLLREAVSAFEQSATAQNRERVEEELYGQIGRLKMELEWLKKAPPISALRSAAGLLPHVTGSFRFGAVASCWAWTSAWPKSTCASPGGCTSGTNTSWFLCVNSRTASLTTV